MAVSGKGKECVALIELKIKQALSIADALAPDNETAPSHVNVGCEGFKSYLKCFIKVAECNNPRRVLTFRNTLNDLLISLKSAIEVLKGLE